MLGHGESPEAPISEASMRSALAGTIVIVYLVLLRIATQRLEWQGVQAEHMADVFPEFILLAGRREWDGPALIENREAARGES